MPNFDYDLVVVGSGAAGLTAATLAATYKAKVLLIEKELQLGGDCLHYGCVPSKTLIKSAYCFNIIRNAQKYGLPEIKSPPVDFNEIRQRIRRVIGTIQVEDTPEALKSKYGIETKYGLPTFVDKNTININNEKIIAKNFILATGSTSLIPAIPGLSSVPFLTNKHIFSLESLPASMIILGAGTVGLEMAQAFHRLGTKVTVIESAEQLLPQEDKDVAEFIADKLRNEGIKFILKASVKNVSQKGREIFLQVEHEGVQDTISADKLFIAVGRKANCENLNLEKAGVAFSEKAIFVDERLRTSARNIYACGDVTGILPFTHVASYQASVAVANAVQRIALKASYSTVPWCVYLDPEIATVGLNEKRAQEKGIPHKVHIEMIGKVDRAKVDDETDGFVKILTDNKNRVIGVQIAAFRAGDLIQEWASAIDGKISLGEIAKTIRAYPTMNEISTLASQRIIGRTLINNVVSQSLKNMFGIR